MSNEIWVPAYGYEGLYEVSNLGRVRSLPKRGTKGGIMKNHISEKGYYYVQLSKHSKGRQKRIHRLVYESFIGLIPEDMTVNHINEEKSDNSLINLNLMSLKDNCNWGTRNERISKSQYKKILCYDKKTKEFVSEYDSPTAAAEILGCSRKLIYEAALGFKKTYFGFIWKYKDNE